VCERERERERENAQPEQCFLSFLMCTAQAITHTLRLSHTHIPADSHLQTHTHTHTHIHTHTHSHTNSHMIRLLFTIYKHTYTLTFTQKHVWDDLKRRSLTDVM
jgi:hypothetical protein